MAGFEIVILVKNMCQGGGKGQEKTIPIVSMRHRDEYMHFTHGPGWLASLHHLQTMIILVVATSNCIVRIPRNISCSHLDVLKIYGSCVLSFCDDGMAPLFWEWEIRKRLS